MDEKKTKKAPVKKAAAAKKPAAAKKAVTTKKTVAAADVKCPHCGKSFNPAETKKPAKKGATPKVLIKTNKGEIELELYPDKAPATVQNFLDYVNAGHYKGLIFHRVIKGFMIQGGGMNPSMQEAPTKAPIKIESNNGLENLRGTIAMARTMDPNSATSQFFINHVDNPFLNFRSEDVQGYGYTVFGKVTKGIDTVDKIAETPTMNRGHYQDIPKENMVIESITAIK